MGAVTTEARSSLGREVLLNAVIHRNYTDGSDIQIKIFDNKISIFSPGVFYGGISVADIQADNYRSSLRSKLVAEGFYLTGKIEKYGSGFIRISLVAVFRNIVLHRLGKRDS